MIVLGSSLKYNANLDAEHVSYHDCPIMVLTVEEKTSKGKAYVHPSKEPSRPTNVLNFQGITIESLQYRNLCISNSVIIWRLSACRLFDLSLLFSFLLDPW